MPEIKEKPRAVKTKDRRKSAGPPRQAGRLMKEKLVREVDQRKEREAENGSYAVDQVEQAGVQGADEFIQALRPNHKRKADAGNTQSAKENRDGRPDREAPPQERPASAPKERRPAEGQTPQRQETAPRERSPDGQQAVPIRERTRIAAKKRGRGKPPPGTGAPGCLATRNTYCKGGAGASPRAQVRRISRRGPPQRGGTGRSRHPGARGGYLPPCHGRDKTQDRSPRRKGTRCALAGRQGASGAQGPGSRKACPAIYSSVPKTSPSRTAVSPAPPGPAGGPHRKGSRRTGPEADGGGGPGRGCYDGESDRAGRRRCCFDCLIIVVLIAAIASSPFGIFFTNEPSAPETVSVSQAVAAVNVEYNAKLETLQAGDYDDIVIHGQGPDWAEVLAVFAVHTAGSDGGVDVVTLDQDRVDRLKAVFWDMTEITSKVETIDHPGGEDSEGWTESILHITITPKTADEMRAVYAFTDEQNSALTELLSDQAALASLAGSLTITSADLLEVIRALPADLDQARKEAVETALSLVGKVGYFWGGKSLVIGWDSRWGTLREVTAAGSSTTGTYRPYGLDCSGMMDWIFYNITGGEYILGRGGGATAQRSYCTPVSQADAQPGDLAFYPDDSHVGIVVGRREDGKLLICHCSSGQNNVVVTEFAASGFTTLGRPDIFQ